MAKNSKAIREPILTDSSPPTGGDELCLEGCGLLEILAVFADVEAGAGLVGAGELLVAYDAGLRVVGM